MKMQFRFDKLCYSFDRLCYRCKHYRDGGYCVSDEQCSSDDISAFEVSNFFREKMEEEIENHIREKGW